MIEGIILAGGYSSRIKTNKMKLMYKGKSLICNVIESMQEIVDRIVVVTGHYHDEVLEVVKKYEKVTVVKNENYDLGMFSSVMTGVKAIKNDFFLIPGDYPLIKKNTYKVLAQAGGPIRVPLYNLRRGHPIFIEKNLIAHLLNEPADSNLKLFRNKYQVNYVNTNDEGVLIDVDTMVDYLGLPNINERNEIDGNS